MGFKTEFPSLFIGFLYKLIHGASLVLDIDDDELAFVRADTSLNVDEFLRDLVSGDWREPYAKRWTQLAMRLFPTPTRSRSAIPFFRKSLAGTIVRHARGDAQFEIARAKRADIRHEFGFSDEDKIVLFLGTPRRHKGILDVAAALRAIADPRAVFCIVGTVPDRELKRQLELFDGVRIALHPDQPYSRLAEVNAMGDVVCALQDPTDRIVQSQTPAKLTDAIATGTDDPGDARSTHPGSDERRKSFPYPKPTSPKHSPRLWRRRTRRMQTNAGHSSAVSFLPRPMRRPLVRPSKPRRKRTRLFPSRSGEYSNCSIHRCLDRWRTTAALLPRACFEPARASAR